MAEPTVRRATRADADGLRQLAVAAYQHYLDRMDRPPAPMLTDYAQLLDDSEVWLIETSRGLAGFVALFDRSDHLEAGNLAVDPEWQGRGFGGLLMRLAERRAVEHGYTELRLYTNEVMTENLELYRHLGFAEIGRAEQAGYRRVFLAKNVIGSP